MSTKKILIGGIAGGITFFILGWLVYGLLLNNFMQSNAGSATGVQRAPEEMVMWSLALGNLCLGFLFAYIINRAGVTSASDAAGIAGLTGLLACAGFDFIMYGTSHVANLTATIVDIAAFTVISAVTGTVIALVAVPKRRIVSA